MQERCCRWFRVSSDYQDEVHQYQEVNDHIARKGYEVARTFVLHADSASKGEHEPQLDELLADIKAKKYTVVVIAHSSRLDRRHPDLAAFTAVQIRLAGARVESTSQPLFGTDGIAGRLYTEIAHEADHEYAKTLSGHVRRAKNTIKTNGAWDGHPPFGLEIVGEKLHKQLVITDEGRQVIPVVFQRIVEKKSLSEIAKEISEILGRPVWAGTVGGWVRNPAYRGMVSHYDKPTKTYGKVKLRIEPLVPADVWVRANKELNSRPSNSRGKQYVRRDPETGKKVYTKDPAGRALLSGILVCGLCGGPMYRANLTSKRLSGPDKKNLYYRCYGTGANRKNCGAPMTPLDATESLAIKLMQTLNIRIPVTELVAGENHEAEIQDVEFELRDLSPRDPGYRARHDELMDELERLQKLPVTEDRWETTLSDVTFSDDFFTQPIGGRNKWLKDHGMQFTAQRGGKSPMWDDLPKGKRRSRASDGDVIVTVTYSPGRLLQRGSA